ncbi:MAG TPA: hypothetical protein VH601_24440 [Bryobacteraceae bacterium]|jgi:Ni,Fe-hydrogenase III small subunit
MSHWVLKGLKTGIKSTRYPEQEETRPGVSPGLPSPGSSFVQIADICPTGALLRENNHIAVDYGRCVHCFRCARTTDLPPLAWQSGYEWGFLSGETAGDAPTNLERRTFGRSLHVHLVDAGDCEACLSEITQLNNPYYNMHRLGFFVTPTPRSADVLLVVGPVTDHTRQPLQKAYDAMPTPKRVVAVGACALSGGVFGPSFIAGSGVGNVVPVDVLVPGCPPPPLAILHALLVAVDRKPSGLKTLSARFAEENVEAG